ncbi:phytase-like protein with esterase activity [Pseudomonas duriflava]|uniref:Phytase-like protein with esterase activity n=1 Tax=Pseudomonas duriflava TaxID=459528 RepID=A0A562QDW3_9PSED|nr:esterase-like activity of phytase family protein [Pseudomonas duriflava]TWI54226.1 phytase-like protein with esterase activity [Pseudomonas duriflava]
MRKWKAWLFLLAFNATAVSAQAIDELKLVAEYPVEGMRGGNLSGLAVCQGNFWAVSDRDDDRYYRLHSEGPIWKAEAHAITALSPPESHLPWNQRVFVRIAEGRRGGSLDLEGITCDRAGNRYLVSEGFAAVLQDPVQGKQSWIKWPDQLMSEANRRGLLTQFNSLYEGLTVSPDGQELWLAAERQRRGLLTLFKQGDGWVCQKQCVIFAEGGTKPIPPALGKRGPLPVDFSDIAYYQGKLFTLERAAHQVCRRDPKSGRSERCWSFAATLLAPTRHYKQNWGLAEALWIDERGAWIGLDTGDLARADGDTRSYVLHYATPTGGWVLP